MNPRRMLARQKSHRNHYSLSHRNILPIYGTGPVRTHRAQTTTPLRHLFPKRRPIVLHPSKTSQQACVGPLSCGPSRPPACSLAIRACLALCLCLACGNNLRAQFAEHLEFNPATTSQDTSFTGLVDTANAFDATSYFSNAPQTVFDVGYDSGIYWRLQRVNDSFELKTNVRLQFRLISFSRNQDTWTDNAGNVRPIEDRRNFDIERFRFILSGHAFTPQLKYFVQFDGDTDSQHVVSILDGWFAWHFSDSLEVQFGKRKVSSTRNWMLGAFDTRLVDRPFSNEFFRPSRTTGIWLISDPSPTAHYEFMIGQGYNTEGLTPAELGNNFAIGGTAWWDVVGSYGPARPTDFEWHDDLAVRIGSSLVSSKEGTPGQLLEETDFLRLTDGTRITEPGALAPGVTVSGFDVTLATVDTAFKYRGWSANAEYFWRTITHLQTDQPVPRVGLQHGFYIEGGYFIAPQLFEVNSQIAYVNGRQGSTTSFTAGFSYFPRMTQYLKLSLDATFIDGSPVNSTGSDILVGDSGVLIRAQCQALF